MPDSHFIGEVVRATVPHEAVSLTWAIVPGNSAWMVKNGLSFGESQTGFTSQTSNTATINHPIDVQYESSSAEGWPLFVCELWDRSYENGMRGFLGCGCVWLPCNSTTNGKLAEQTIELSIWRPCSNGLEGLTDMLLPSCPDLKSIRELTVSPYLRSQLQTEQVGTVSLRVTCITSGFSDFGVQC